MPSIAEVLLNVQGQSEGAQQAVRSVADEIRRVPNTATTTFRAEVADLDAKLRLVDRQLSDIDRRHVSPTVSAKIDRLLADVTTARAYLDTLPDHKTIDLNARASIETTLARISAQMAAMGVQAGQWGDALERAATTAEQRIPRTVTIDLRATRQNLERDLNDAEQTLRVFSGRGDLQPRARLKIDQLLIDVMKARATLDLLPDHKEVDLRTRAGIEQDLLRIKNLIGDVSQEADRGAQAFASMGSAASGSGGGGGGGIGGLVDGLASLSPELQGIGIVLLVSLIPALLALVASLGSAASGVGVLATAFLGALGPGVLFAIDLMKRLTDVFQAFQLVSQAQTQTQKDNAQGAQEAAQNAEQQYIATQAVQRAQDNLRESTQRLADARRTAAQDIVQKYHDEQNAIYQLQQADQAVRQSQIDGYRAIEDAITRVRDAVLALQNAQLGIIDAKLRIDEAKQALIDFRNQVGLTGPAFDDLFKRLANVNIEQNPQVVAALLKRIQQQGNLSGDDAIRLRQLIEDLAHAQVDASGAANTLTKAQRELSRARQDELPYLQRGLDAYKPYVDALHQQADAQYNARKAIDAYNLAQQQGVDRNPQVLAAIKAVQDATIQLADAQHRAALAAAYGPSSAQSAWEQANAALAKLTPAERTFLSALMDFVNFLHTAVQPATDAVFGAFATGIERAQVLLGQLRGGIGELGQAIAGAVDKFTKGMTSPHMVDNWVVLTHAAAQLASILGGRVFTAFVELMTNFAVAAMPELIKLLTELANWLDALVGDTSNIAATRQWLQPFFSSLETWLVALGQIMDLVLAFFRDVGPYGDKLVRFIGQAAEKMAQWLNSRAGQEELRRFFERIVPLSEQLFRLLGQLAIAFMLLLQDGGPAITGLITLLTKVVEFLNLLLGLLSHVPAPLLTALGYIAGLALTWKGLSAAFGILRQLPAWLAEAFAPLRAIAGWLVAFLLNPLKTIWGFVEAFVIPIIEAIGSAIAGLAAVIGAPVEVVVAIIAAIVAVAVLVITHWREVEKILGGIWHNLGVSASFVAGVIGRAWRAAVRDVGSIVNAVVGAVNAVGKWLAGAAGWVGGAASSVARAISNGLGHAVGWVRGVGNAIAGAFHWIVDTIGSILHGLGDIVSGAFSWVVDAIRGSINFIIDIANDFIKLWDKTPFGGGIHFDAGPLGHVDIPGLHIPTIPKLELGGVVNSSTLAQLGEGAASEAVLPLTADTFKKLGSAIARALPRSAGEGGIVQHNEFNIKSPAGTNPDPAFTVSRIADGMRRRGLALIGATG